MLPSGTCFHWVGQCEDSHSAQGLPQPEPRSHPHPLIQSTHSEQRVLSTHYSSAEVMPLSCFISSSGFPSFFPNTPKHLVSVHSRPPLLTPFPSPSFLLTPAWRCLLVPEHTTSGAWVWSPHCLLDQKQCPAACRGHCACRSPCPGPTALTPQ